MQITLDSRPLRHTRSSISRLRVTASSNRSVPLDSSDSCSWWPLPRWMYPCLTSFFLYLILWMKRRELIAVHSNGISVRCNGMFLGQLAGTSQLARDVAVTRPWVRYLSHQRVGEIQLLSMYVPLSLFPLPFSLLTLASTMLIIYFYTDEGFMEEVLCPPCMERSTLHPEQIR